MDTPLRRNPPRHAKSIISSTADNNNTPATLRKRPALHAQQILPPKVVSAEDRLPLPLIVSLPDSQSSSARRHKVHQDSSAFLNSNFGSANATQTTYPVTESSPIPSQTARPAKNAAPSAKQNLSASVKTVQVYLRIRPARISRRVSLTKKTQKDGEVTRRRVETKASSGDDPSICLHQGSDSVTLIPPASFSAIRRSKIEEFNGFSHIFGQNASQEVLFDKILLPKLTDLINGKSSLVVALGPTSAGKTHTMLGSPEDPGLVPRSLQYLFETKSDLSSTSIKISISMFEIYSEQGGRYEKILDLLQNGAELHLQQHLIKGLHEAFVSSAEEARSILFSGLQRRTTASTAANHFSSRSHCIINISATEAEFSRDDHWLIPLNHATLTIADLAGFERERKTGNQGVRLNESNFINNTSMVFGQCLRALLEHQKNPKNALQKHFQYSMLTRYLKPYMQAKGNMTLIINVSPCEEDYLDTAFVLKQVAPYSTIRLSLVCPNELTAKQNVKKKAIAYQDGHCARKRRKMNAVYWKDDKSCGHCNMQRNDAVKKKSSGDNDSGIETSQVEHEDNNFRNAMKQTVIANVNKILEENKVENAMGISHMILDVLDNAMEQHCKRFQCIRYRLGKYVRQPFPTENLYKEQQTEVHLLKELESLKQYCKDLESRLMASQSDIILSQSEERLATGYSPEVSQHVGAGLDEAMLEQQLYQNDGNILELSKRCKEQMIAGAIETSCSPERKITIVDGETGDENGTKDENILETSGNSVQQFPITSTLMAQSDVQVVRICSPYESEVLTLQPCIEAQADSPQSDVVHKITMDNEEHRTGQESLNPVARKDITNTNATESSNFLSYENVAGAKVMNVSSFAKGKLLALSLMEELQLPHPIMDDVEGRCSNVGVVTQAVGPIGLDLEGLLDIPLSEIETELWARKGCKLSKLSELLRKSGGVLDLNSFPRQFSQQRSLCLRYCLAVLCGHMNTDGIWIPLSKATVSSRRDRFYAITKAKTVSQAVVLARSAFQEEAQSITSLAKDDEENIPTKTVTNENVLKPKVRYNNENEGYRSAKKSAAPKRRKLQPLSSLCLESSGNKLIADFEDGDTIDNEPSAGTLPRRSNCLASLLV